MILDRKEFNVRWSDRNFDTKKEIIVDFPIRPLYEEIQKDAEYRNHEYLFKNIDFNELPLQEETVGILNKVPDIKTEGDRLREIKAEVQLGIYEPVELFQDIDHPTVIYVNDGFHRIFVSQMLGKKTVKCKVKIGHFILSDTMKIRDVIYYVDFLGKISGEKDLEDAAKRFSQAIDKEFSDGVLFGDVRIGGRQTKNRLNGEKKIITNEDIGK